MPGPSPEDRLELAARQARRAYIASLIAVGLAILSLVIG